MSNSELGQIGEAAARIDAVKTETLKKEKTGRLRLDSWRKYSTGEQRKFVGYAKKKLQEIFQQAFNCFGKDFVAIGNRFPVHYKWVTTRPNDCLPPFLLNICWLWVIS